MAYQYRHWTLSLYAVVNPKIGEVIGPTALRQMSRNFCAHGKLLAHFVGRIQTWVRKTAGRQPSAGRLIGWAGLQDRRPAARGGERQFRPRS